MSLFKTFFDKKLSMSTECELTGDHMNSILFFYDAYRVACNIVGFHDSNMKVKDKLQSSLIIDSTGNAYSKLNAFMQKDISVINLAISQVEQKKFSVGFYGCLDNGGAIGVSMYDDIQQ